MKLQDQVTSLELSKKLKELGVKQESLFYWEIDRRHWDNESLRQDPYLRYRWSGLSGKEVEELKTSADSDLYSAFTCSELGEMLPWDIRDTKDFSRGRLVIEKSPINPTWKATYVSDMGRLSLSNKDENIANSIAKLLIYLIEQGLISKEKIC